MISSCTVESTRTITATLSPCLGSALIVFIDDSFFFPFLTISHRFACVTKVRRHINRDQSGFAIFCLIEKSCGEADNLPIQTFSPRKLSTISKLPWNSSARSPRTLLLTSLRRKINDERLQTLEDSTPADPPVEQVKKFELIINLKTAMQSGVTIAQSGLEAIYLLIDVLHLGCKACCNDLIVDSFPRTISSVCRSWVSNAAIFALEISASCSVRSAFVVACAIAKSNWIPASQELLFCI